MRRSLAIGYEVNPLAYAIARLRNTFIPDVKIRFRSLRKENVSAADVIFCYLFPDIMEKLAGKLKKELRPGARVVSCNFPLSSWTHHQELSPDSFFHSGPIYFYQFPDACCRI